MIPADDRGFTLGDGLFETVLARAEARAASVDEALLLNTRGELACAAAANLFWIAGGRLFTPALECGVLAGVTRAAVLARASELGVEAHAVHADPEALVAAEAIFVTNALIGVREVADLDGRKLAPHRLTAQISGLLDT